MRIIINEIKKIILSKKYMVTMIILAILYGFMCYGTYSDTVKNTPENQISRNNKYIESLKIELNDKDVSDERKNQINYKLKDLENFNNSLDFEILSRNLDWKEALEKKNSILKENMKIAEKKEDFNTIQSITKSLETNNYCLKNNIKPSSNYEVTAVSTISKLNMMVAMLILSVIIAIIASDSISGEFNPATIKLLLTKPISRQRVLFSKFIASVLTCSLSLIAIKLIVFLIIGITFRFGDFREPAVFYSQYVQDKDLVMKTGYGVKAVLESLTIYSALKVILLNELITIIYIAACISICFLISTISRKSAVSIGISMIIFAITTIFNLATLFGNVGGDNKLIHKLNLYLFSTYSSGELIITRMITEKLGESFITIPFIIVLLLTWTLVCYLISNTIFVKKDILA